MAIEYIRHASSEAAFVSSYSFSFDATSANSNKILLVFAYSDRGGSQTMDSMTFNGVSMTGETGFTSAITSFDGRLFRLVNPHNGSANIAATMNSSTGRWGFIAALYSGVDQTTPYSNYGTYTPSTISNFTTSVTSTNSSVAAFIGGVLFAGTHGFTPTSPNELIALERRNASSNMYGMIVTRPGAESATINGTLLSNSEVWGTKFSLNPSEQGGSKSNKIFLLGVG